MHVTNEFSVYVSSGTCWKTLIQEWAESDFKPSQPGFSKAKPSVNISEFQNAPFPWSTWDTQLFTILCANLIMLLHWLLRSFNLFRVHRASWNVVKRRHGRSETIQSARTNKVCLRLSHVTVEYNNLSRMCNSMQCILSLFSDGIRCMLLFVMSQPTEKRNTWSASNVSSFWYLWMIAVHIVMLKITWKRKQYMEVYVRCFVESFSFVCIVTCRYMTSFCPSCSICAGSIHGRIFDHFGNISMFVILSHRGNVRRLIPRGDHAHSI